MILTMDPSCVTRETEYDKKREITFQLSLFCFISVVKHRYCYQHYYLQKQY